MGANKIKVLLLLGALVLFVLLFIAPKITPKETDERSLDSKGNTAINTADANLQVYLNLALKSLGLKEKQSYDSLLSLKRYDSLAVLWNTFKRADLAAFFIEEQAKIAQKAGNWFAAGNRYYYAVPFTKDKTEEPILYQCAMRCFENGLKLDAKNTDAKIMLASCFVESGLNPMEGINQLKDIEKTDSANVKLQLTFAFFSVKSGQLDKAISRFKKVVQLDPEYLEAYLHLADAYEQLGETEKTIQMLEMYASKTRDVTARLEINKYIEQLKQK
jgi:tetratricopeptide (TPR) repeat protein